MTPSLGFISLLEWLTGFKKVHSLTQSLIYYKGYELSQTKGNIEW